MAARRMSAIERATSRTAEQATAEQRAFRLRRAPPKSGEYVVLTGKKIRVACWKRDGGVCASCGYVSKMESNTYCASWEMWFADHIVPIFMVDKASSDADWHWTIDNLQTLCWKCHKKKTAAEMALRRERAKS